jgi:hypothetical protein
MTRGLIFGALAFAAAFGAERLFASMAPDIARYNKMREMSGQEPLHKEIFAFVQSAFGGSGIGGTVADLTNDVVRYAKMKGM